MYVPCPAPHPSTTKDKVVLDQNQMRVIVFHCHKLKTMLLFQPVNFIAVIVCWVEVYQMS